MNKQEVWKEVITQCPLLAQQMRDKKDKGMSDFLAQTHPAFDNETFAKNCQFKWLGNEKT